MVELGEAADESMHAGEEGVIIAHHQPFAVLARGIIVERGEEGEISLCHLNGAAGVVDLHIHAHGGQAFTRLLQLFFRRVHETQDQASPIGMALSIRQPVGPLQEGAGLGVRQSLVRGRDAKQEIAGVDRLWERGFGHGQLQRLQAGDVCRRVLEVNMVKVFREEILVHLGQGLAVHGLGEEVNVSARILDAVAQVVFHLERLQVGGVKGAVGLWRLHDPICRAGRDGIEILQLVVAELLLELVDMFRRGVQRQEDDEQAADREDNGAREGVARAEEFARCGESGGHSGRRGRGGGGPDRGSGGTAEAEEEEEEEG